jgi:hypothetical protein
MLENDAVLAAAGKFKGEITIIYFESVHLIFLP